MRVAAKRSAGAALLVSALGVVQGCNSDSPAPPPPASAPPAGAAAPAAGTAPTGKTGPGTSQPGPGSSASADSTLNPALQGQSKP